MFKKFIGLFIALSLFPWPQAHAAVFIDINSTHPNYQAIKTLYETGVINGYPDNSFRPDKKVNRAEALKIILLGSDIFVPEIAAQDIFPDVTADTWYGKFALKAKNLKIVKGDADTGFFRPGDTVNLAEALKILLETNGTKTIQPTKNPYSDVDKSAWYAPYFSYAKGAKLIDGEEQVQPNLPITRGLLSEMMYRLSRTSYVEPDGEASYYGEKFHGKTTANGEVFDASQFTAAHRTYAFGTWLKVTNVANGESIKVRVNDRGPYAGENRIIDLSKAAFEAISPLSRGIIEVAIEETIAPTNEEQATEKASELTFEATNPSDLNRDKVTCPEVASLGFIPVDFFENINLENEIPNRILQNETLVLKGSTLNTLDQINAFIVNEKNEQTPFMAPVKDGKFTNTIHFPSTGTYKLGIIPGASGQSLIKEIKVVANNCIEEREDEALTPLEKPNLKVNQGITTFNWSASNYNLFKLSFSQEGKENQFIIKNENRWNPHPIAFQNFAKGNMTLKLRGANLNQNSILRPDRINWSPATEVKFKATHQEEFIIKDNEIDLIQLTEIADQGEKITTELTSSVPIRSTAAIILPDGTVEEVKISSSADSKKIGGVEVIPANSGSLKVNYDIKKVGTYFFEVNNDQGLAVINTPVYPSDTYPLLPNPRQLSGQQVQNLSGNADSWRTELLSLVNRDRSQFNLSALKLDDQLTQLAQFRSDDMATNNYFSHWDQQGRSANDLRLNYGISTLIGENLAKDINLELAQYGLMRSAIHRDNILSKDWTRAGLGIAKNNDGTYTITQIFSTDPLDLNNIDELRTNLLEVANEKRNNNLVISNLLNNVAQNWSEKMANEEFFDFVDGDGKLLTDLVRAEGVQTSIGTYLIGNSSFADALEQLKKNTQITDSRWKEIGIGIKQDKLGLINITLVYSE